VASPLARSSKVLTADVPCRIREMFPEIKRKDSLQTKLETSSE